MVYVLLIQKLGCLRGLQQTSYVVCREKRGIPATSGEPAGQALKIYPMGSPILLKCLRRPPIAGRAKHMLLSCPPVSLSPECKSMC